MPVERVRLSLGTAIQMGLMKGELDAVYTTAFFMTFHEGKCFANCAFCPQARQSTSSLDRLSRIAWPDFPLEQAIERLHSATGFSRICIQCLNYPNVVDDVIFLTQRIRTVSVLPLSVAIAPISEQDMNRLREAGVTNIGIAMDASTPKLFDTVKGKGRNTNYRWEHHIEALKKAQTIFGKGNVTTHLIVGLGETEADALSFLKEMYTMGIGVGLFAFTNIRGTSLENASPPELSRYRRIQVVRYLLDNRLINPNALKTDESGHIAIEVDPEWLENVLSSGEAFQTSGCKGCNRPYYNERPRGPMYNYHRPLSKLEIKQAIRDSELV